MINELISSRWTDFLSSLAQIMNMTLGIRGHAHFHVQPAAPPLRN